MKKNFKYYRVLIIVFNKPGFPAPAPYIQEGKQLSGRVTFEAKVEIK